MSAWADETGASAARHACAHANSTPRFGRLRPLAHPLHLLIRATESHSVGAKGTTRRKAGVAKLPV